jgi:hypothetical protein
MSRGRPPLVALRRAQEIACQRGVVLDAAVIQGSSYDFILFCSFCSVFVRVKRIRAHISDPTDIAFQFKEEILLLRRLPKTAVVSREIRVVSPWGAWQHFLVCDDSIVEIRYNGLPVLPVDPAAGAVPGKMTAPVVPDTVYPARAGIRSS